MKDLIVKHKTFGMGKVCAVEGCRVFVSFGDIVKIFSAEHFFDFFTVDAETAEMLKKEIDAELEAERERERERKRKVENERTQKTLALRKELLKKLKSYGFEGFLHTTEFENFRKIVKGGYLRSRTDLKNAGVRFIDRANFEVLGKTDTDIKNFARFYYRFGTPTNFAADYFRPVTLVFDENLIFDQGVLFSLGNAAIAAVHKTESAEEALQFDWERVFEKGPIERSRYLPGDEQLRGEVYKSIKAIRNAEFLYPEKVSVSRVVKVYFTCDAAKKEAESFCGASLRTKLVSDISKFEFLRWGAR